MKNSNLKHLIALTALAFLAGSIEKTHAQNNWTLTGASPGGGFTIAGSGTDLGALGPSTVPVFLSPHGGDIITLNAGGVATSTGGEVIDLETSYNTLNNHGTITNPTSGEYGILIDTNAGGNTINNWGTINGYYGVVIYGPYNTVNNWGLLTSVNEAVYLDANFNTINNWGTISSGGDYGLIVYGDHNTINNWGSITSTADYPLYIYATNTTVNNHGTITSPYDPVWEDGGSNNTINNWGSITTPGDYGIYTDGSNFTFNNWGTLSSGYYDAIYSDGGNLTVNNWGAISCSSGDGIDLYANTNTINNHGTISAGDDAIYMESSNNTINNWGTITSPGDAVYVYGQDIYTNNVVNNWGTITSANDTGVYLDTQDTLNNWGNINGGSYGVELYDPTNTVTNYFSGKITGASSALFLDDDNQTVTNWGTLSTPSTGSGVIYDDGDAFNVITNHGYIFGNGGPAIVLNSTTDETINMVGHSVVVGPIEITGVGNVVNFNLTGLSPAKIAALNAILIPQGVNSGNVTNSVVFTLNGVNYNIDPATVYFHATSYEAQALTPNQFAIARSLDSLNSIPTPSLMALFNAIDASGNVPGALNALSPVKYALYGDLAIENATATVQGVDRRLNNLRDGSESVDTTGVGGDTVAAVVTGDPSKDGSKESKQVVQPEPQENRWGFFASGDGLFFRGSQGTGLQDGKSNTAGALAGVDGKVGDHVVIGALFAYNNSAVDLGNDGSHATIESYSGGIYGSYNQDGFYLNSLAAYTRNNYTSSSNVLFPGFATTGNGSTHGNQYAANIDGGYDWNVTNRLTLGPIAGLQYVHLDVNSFDESGGGADLGVDSQSVNSLQSRLGAKAEYKIAMTAHSSFGAEAYVAWQHEYLDNSRGIGASFEGGGLTPFTVQTGSPERDAAVVGAALNCTFHNRLTLFADYELQMWNQNYFEQSVNGGAKISW